MSDEVTVILAALGFIAVVTILVLWLRSSDRGGSSTSRGFDAMGTVDDIVSVDAVIDVVEDLLDD